MVLEPKVAEANHLRWEIGGVVLDAEKHAVGWRLKITGELDTVHLTDKPRVIAQLGETDAVAHLANPLSLGAQQSLTFWLGWPLSLAIYSGDSRIHTLRPGGRRTLLGTQEEGQVLPASRCEVLDSPPTGPPWVAGLRVIAENIGDTAATLRRCPVSEGSLSAYLLAGRVIAGTMRIRIVDADRAEAQRISFPAPAGATPMPRTGEGDGPGRFQWLLDAGRRGAEFQL